MRLEVKAEVFQMQRWQVIEPRLPGRVPLQSKYNIPADPTGLVSPATCPAWGRCQVRTFQLMGGNFQPRAASSPWPLYQLCNCATTTVGGCWPHVTVVGSSLVFWEVSPHGMLLDSCRGMVEVEVCHESHCLPTWHLCCWFRGAFANATSSQHQVNGEEML